MLGAGFVTRPTLDILSEAGIPVTVGRRTALPYLPPGISTA
jgi:saccharopine dehydrogenase (NADP+, L-glutamate forming)